MASRMVSGTIAAVVLVLCVGACSSDSGNSDKPQPTSPGPASQTGPQPTRVTEHGMRTWVSADGKFTSEASFVRYASKTVTLQKPDGTTIVVEYGDLSKDDKEYVMETHREIVKRRARDKRDMRRAGSGGSGTQESLVGSGYRIVKREDISMKALTKPLSSYQPGEVYALPRNVRMVYRIVVPSDISPDQLKSTMIQLVKDETAKDPDIDEITVFAYDREEDANGSYTFGKLSWCPNGDWAGVTPAIARSNDRTNYQYDVHIMGKVGDPTSRPTQREYQLYDALEKALWADPEVPEEEVNKVVARKLKITVEQLKRAWLTVVAYHYEMPM